MADETPEAVNDPALSIKANKAIESVKKTEGFISKIHAELSKEEVWKRVRAFNLPPEYDSLVNHDFVKDVLPEILRIAEQYKTGDFNPVEMDEDILKLGSNLVYFVGKVNHLDVVALDAETTHDQAYERTILEIREIMDRDGPKLTKETVEALASTYVEDRRELHIVLKALAHTMKGTYFAAKDLLQVMDSVSSRLFKERFLPGQ